MISICIATYNGEKYIKEQLHSILNQINIDDEIIISDDNSTDNTIQIIEGIKDNRIKIYYNYGKKGYSGNFENAIKLSRGDYIFLSDQDDIWMDKKVNTMINKLKDNHMVVSDAQFVDENLNPLNNTYFSLRGGKKGYINNLYKARYLGACFAFRKEILDKLLPFPSKEKLCPHDLWITLISEFYYKVGLINEPLIMYRRHGNNVSSGGLKSELSFTQKILFRLYSSFMVISRIFK